VDECYLTTTYWVSQEKFRSKNLFFWGTMVITAARFEKIARRFEENKKA
jgi:hypothetical protein